MRRSAIFIILAALALPLGWLAMTNCKEPPKRPSPFDAKRSLTYLEDICKIGPRISGSPGMKKQQDLLVQHFEKCGGKVHWQTFEARQHSQRQPVEMANLIVSWHPERERRVILCCHYDTRPIADEEPDRRRWTEDFVSANDGGSGVAFLMEMGHHLKDLKINVGVDFVFFDGEEYFYEKGDDYFFGSKHFAAQYARDRKQKKERYLGAVLLDMIAGKDAIFAKEQTSAFKAGALTAKLWDIAAKEKCDRFKNRIGAAVLDDHGPLNDVGIPAVDIIDNDGDIRYPHWHRLSDVPANCGEEPMLQVARVLMVWLQSLP